MNKILRTVYLWLVTHRRVFEKYIFPIALFLYPFTGVYRGIDVTDTTYALGGFLYPDRMQSMWKLSTYLHQQTGSLLMKMPLGDTMLGMNLWTTLFISVSALAAYYLLRVFIPAWMIFIGEWIAVSLCWCPHVILYNYLTYMLFSLGAVFLVRGLTATTRGKFYLFAAGVALGQNVMVRFPNIVECALIICVIYYAFITDKSALECLREIPVCVAGFGVGFLVPYIVVRVNYGAGAYGEMITALFDMSKAATEYSGAGMLKLILSAYSETFSKMLIMLPCIVAGVVLFSVLPDKFLAVKRAVYIAGVVLLVVYFYVRRVITLNYWYYDSVFQIAMMFIMISLLFFIIDLTGLIGGSRPERLLSLTALMMILILPLGSNNYTYPVLNCLFFIAPVSMGVFRRVFRAACGTWSEQIFQKKKASIGRYFQNEEEMRHRSRFFRQHFAWVSVTTAVVAVLIFQSTLFHLTFVFRDGTTRDGRSPCPMDTVTEIPKLAGMKTTAYNAESLNQLYAFTRDNSLQGRETLFFGDIPGISYIMDLPPAIFSTWPDLDSVGVEEFDSALMSLQTEPLILISGDGTGYAYTERKYNLLRLYMQEHEYNEIYNDGLYRMYDTRKDRQ